MPFSVPGKFSNLQFNFPRSSWRRVTRRKLYKYLYLTLVYCFQTSFTYFLNSYDGLKCSVYTGIFDSFLFFQAKRPQNGVQVQGNFESIQTYIKINNNEPDNMKFFLRFRDRAEHFNVIVNDAPETVSIWTKFYIIAIKLETLKFLLRTYTGNLSLIKAAQHEIIERSI